MLSRRNFILSAGASFVAAPAIIKTPGVLMPVKKIWTEAGPIIENETIKVISISSCGSGYLNLNPAIVITGARDNTTIFYDLGIIDAS